MKRGVLGAVLAIGLFHAVCVPAMAGDGDMRIEIRQGYAGTTLKQVFDASSIRQGDYTKKVLINGETLFVTQAAAERLQEWANSKNSVFSYRLVKESDDPARLPLPSGIPGSERNKALQGDIYQTLVTSGPNECYNRCLGDQGCAAWMFYEGMICALYTNADYSFDRPDTISGRLSR
ncbi:hypothetical protein [Roseibium sp.]|uniref:hypothetical protein n=1 Tax=Roseibium sp. TaxID=1936156 RepID=UPI003A976C4B